MSLREKFRKSNSCLFNKSEKEKQGRKEVEVVLRRNLQEMGKSRDG